MLKLISLLNKCPKVSILNISITKKDNNKNKISNFFDAARLIISSIKPKKMIQIKKSKK